MAEGHLREKIEANNAKFKEFYNNGDIKSLAKLYTEDCRFMAPGKATQIGRQAVEDAFSGMKSGVAKIKLNTDEVSGVDGGEMVIERGNFAMYKEDGTTAGLGKYIVIWKNVGGVYHLHMDCFNTD